MAWKDKIGGKGGRRALEGLNFTIYTAVVIAIIVVINIFVNRNYHKQWDMTPNKTFTLSAQTIKILKGLDRDVTIYNFDRQNGGQARDLLKNFSDQTPHVTIRTVDPVRDPELARQMGVRSDGTIIVASGDRHFQAQTIDEEGLTNAFVRLLKGQKTVYFVQGHGERDLESNDRGGFSQLKKEFENENFQVNSLVLLQKMSIPADCSVLVIAGPHSDYLQQETDVISNWVDSGGRLLLLMDPGVKLPNLDKLLEEWNVTPRNDLVIDENPLAQIYGGQPSMPLIIKYGSSPIVEPLARTMTLFPLTRSFEIGKDYKTGVVDNSLCETTEESFGVADFDPKMQTVSYRPDKDFKGPLTVAVSGTLNVNGPTEHGQAKKPEGRFVALGTSSIGVNAYIGFGGNRDLIMNGVNWLSAEEDLISIRPRPPENQHLDLTVQQMSRIFFVGVLGIPILIIIAGLSVWWSRR